MKVKIEKFQQGGATPEAGTQDPAAQIQALAEQLIQQLGAEGSMLLAQAIVQMVQGAAEQAPQEAPTYMKKGGKLVRVNKK